MADYRAFFVGSDGHFGGYRAFVCDTDEQAIVRTIQLLQDQPIELWSGARLVKRLFPRDKGEASSHEVHEGRLVPKGTK
jgi:hypothetical protein